MTRHRDSVKFASVVRKSDEILARNETLEKENLHLRERANSLGHKVERLQDQIDYYLRRIYGPKRERFEDPAQLRFFDDADLAEAKTASSEEDEETIEVISKRRKSKPKGKKPLPEHLRRERVEWDPDPSDCVCGCCSKEMKRVGELVTEELVVKPPEFLVRQLVQGRFCCEDCMNRTIEKPLPPRPIEQGRPSPSLLAYIIVSKWVDHMPLYRQEQIYKRIGYALSRKTMDGWLGILADLLRPIVDAIDQRLLATSFLQVDETTMRYIADEKKGKSQQGYLWAVTRPREEIVYHFTKSRSGKHPKRFLAGFRGKVQSDGYAGYDGLVGQGVALLACMAHIRRGFYETRYALPEEVKQILTLIRDLYLIERRRREEQLDAEVFAALRESESKPIAAKLREKIDRIAEAVLPQSKLGKAAAYARNMWSRFEETLATPEAPIDNNWVENAMRPAVLGRKNWLQLGSAAGGGNRLEVFLTLAQSCRRLGANAFDYLEDVIERVSVHPQSRVHELTPRGWMQARGLPIAAERED